MTLRVRLLLAFGYLVSLILLASGVALVGFVSLSKGIEVVLAENFASMDASMRMLESLESQDRVTIAALLEERGRITELETLAAEFEKALMLAEGNITEQTEPSILRAIRQEYSSYRMRRDALIAELPEGPLATYEREVFPRLASVKQHVRGLLDINHEAMVNADHEARKVAIQTGAVLALLVTIALLSFILLSRALHTWILSRLDALQAEFVAVASGDLDRRLREAGNDELTLIARQVNALLDRLSAQQARSRGRLSLERQLGLGLLREIGPEASVYSLSGDLLAGERIADQEGSRELVGWIKREGRRRVENPSSAPSTEILSLGAEEAEVHLLTAPPSRPVGWLVRRL